MREHRQHHQLTRGLFAGCSARDVEAIRRAGTDVTVPAGTVIHRPGRRAQWAYVILEGQAVAGGESRQRTLGPGDVHGDRALLAGAEQCDELVACTDVRLLILDHVEFTRLMARLAGFAYGIARHLAVA